MVCWCFLGRSDIQNWLTTPRYGITLSSKVDNTYFWQLILFEFIPYLGVVSQIWISDLPWKHQQTTRWRLLSRLWYTYYCVLEISTSPATDKLYLFFCQMPAAVGGLQCLSVFFHEFFKQRYLHRNQKVLMRLFTFKFICRF